MGRKSIASIRRQEIIEHYYALILEEGFENVSTPKIAKRMGTQSSLLMHYFPNKAAIISALIGFIIEKYEKRFQPSLDELGEPKQRVAYIINTLFSHTWDELADEKVFYSLYPLIFRDPSIRRRFKEMFLGLRNVLVAELKRGHDAQVINVPNPEDMANFIISMLEGINFYEKIMGDRDLEERQFELMKSVIWQQISLPSSP